MQKETFSFQETNLFGKLFSDFIEDKSDLSPFGTSKVDDLNLEDFNISDEVRDDLVSVIEEQAGLVELSSKSVYNLNQLKDKNTYTVVTGHQLNVAGGPLFFTYKILATIRACQELANKYPEANFVPVYWAATEDHDYEEINHFFLFGKKIEWEESFKNVPVGDISLKDFDTFVQQWGEIPNDVKSCYTSSKTLKEAHLKLVYHLFGKYGILVLDANDEKLKQHFLPYAVKEIETRFVSENVKQTNLALEGLGYKAQVNPRDCNLFHLEDGKRYRVDIEGEEVTFVGSDKTLGKEEYLNTIKKGANSLSPNVLMRPVYQQIILPNVAYIGGPGELAYWLQLKAMFQSVNVSFPVLVPRFFGMYVPSFIQKKMDKAEFTTDDLFKDIEQIKKEILGSDVEGQELLVQLETQFESYKSGVLTSLEKELNLSLKSFAESAMTRMNKENQNILKRVKKELEGRNSVKIDRFKSVKEYLFQDGVPQERRESVFTYLINNPDFIDQVYQSIDPFDYRFNVLKDA